MRDVINPAQSDWRHDQALAVVRGFQRFMQAIQVALRLRQSEIQDRVFINFIEVERRSR